MSPPATLYSVGSQSVTCIKSMLTRPFWASKGLCTNPAPRTPPVKTFDDFQSTYTLTTKNAYHFIGIHVLQTSKSLTTKGDLHLLSPYKITHWGKMFFSPCHECGTKKKIASSHEESNLKPSNSALRCSTTGPQRLYGERGPDLRSSCITRVRHTSRISDVCNVMFVYRVRKMVRLNSVKK